jgi:trk system potassium uptake protein TrkH
VNKTPNPARVLVFRFALLVLAGAVLLSLPWASSNGRSVNVVDALFTSMSAVCGGLTVLDTNQDFSRFGHTVLLLLIQLGGLGIMLWSTAVVGLFGVKLGLRERMMLSEQEPGFTLGASKRLAYSMLAFTLVTEVVGCLLLLWFTEESLFESLFHSVSAFCNAGFALYSDNLMSYSGRIDVQLLLIILMLFGSTGFVTVRELSTRRKDLRLSLQGRLVLVSTIALVLLGAIGFWLFEGQNSATLQGQPWTVQLTSSLFSSVTARTTGFALFDYSQLEEGTLLMTIVLMAVGGAPGSTAGGIKLTTFALLIVAAWSEASGGSDVSVWNRRIPTRRILQALSLVVFFAGAVLALSMILHYLEPFAFHQVLFESASALSTTGLSTGITSQLSAPSKLLVAGAMFIGRLGPLTFAVSLIHQSAGKSVSYPTEEVAIG